VEEKFSSSKCASISQNVQERTSRAGHLLFISPQMNRAVGNLTGRISGATDVSIAYLTDAALAFVAPCDVTCLARSTF
jgi:hypothetical protein